MPPVTIPPARSYLSIGEYKNAPTAIDTSTLVPSGDATANDKELANVIARASSWIDQICHQVLAPTTDVERHRVRPGKLGQAYVKTNSFPIVRITALRYTDDPRIGWTSVDLTTATILQDERSFEAYLDLTARRPYRVEVTYENGWANTSLQSNVSAGASAITVVDGRGLYAGEEITIYDGGSTEAAVVSSTYVSGTAVPLSGPLANAHAAGVVVSALPPRVKEAAILATTLLIKGRGAEAQVLDDMEGTRVTGPGGSVIAREDFSALEAMLVDFTMRFNAP